MAKKKSKSHSGAQWAKNNKRSLVWVTLSDDEKKLVRQAAGRLDVAMSAFLKEAGLEKARQVLTNP